MAGYFNACENPAAGCCGAGWSLAVDHDVAGAITTLVVSFDPVITEIAFKHEGIARAIFVRDTRDFWGDYGSDSALTCFRMNCKVHGDAGATVCRVLGGVPDAVYVRAVHDGISLAAGRHTPHLPTMPM